MVVNSRLQKRSNFIWRRRKCIKCGAIFTTVESPDYLTPWRVRSIKGKLSPFSRDKLFLSVYNSCQHRKHATQDAALLTDGLIKGLVSDKATDGVIEDKLIKRNVLVVLNRFDKVASTHYLAFHKV
jgi:transcriptional repressor NrdR